MEKVSRIFRSQVLNVKKNLENILDQDSWSNEDFEISNDYSLLHESLKRLPSDKDERMLLLFGNLNLYFSSGLFLYRKNLTSNDWHLGSSFRYGKFQSIDKILKQTSLKLPPLKTGDLKKIPPFTLLHPLGLCQWSDGTDSSAFVIKFDEYFIGVFLLDLPEPWLRLHIERIYKMVIPSLGLNHGK